MGALKNYNNTQQELAIAQERLNILINKKTKLHTKYFAITSKIKPVMTASSIDKSKMTNYMIELTKIDPKTGMSLDQELKLTANEIFKLQESLNTMTANLLEMTGIEYDLYREIVLRGVNVTKAVEKVADIYNKADTTIWNVYNKKIKKILKL